MQASGVHIAPKDVGGAVAIKIAGGFAAPTGRQLTAQIDTRLAREALHQPRCDQARVRIDEDDVATHIVVDLVVDVRRTESGSVVEILRVRREIKRAAVRVANGRRELKSQTRLIVGGTHDELTEEDAMLHARESVGIRRGKVVPTGTLDRGIRRKCRVVEIWVGNCAVEEVALARTDGDVGIENPLLARRKKSHRQHARGVLLDRIARLQELHL